jgi:N12 class adenine-specific DNA methylase
MLEIREIIAKIMGAKQTAEIQSILQSSFNEPATSDPAIDTPDTSEKPEAPDTGAATSTEDKAPIMGVHKVDNVSLNRLRKEANAAAIEVIERVKGDNSLLTESDIETLRRYSGIGGTDTVSNTGGHIHEYYTPIEIASGVWDGLKAMGFTGGNGLEPSSGTGVFQASKPQGVLMTASEIDQTSSSVNQLLHPEDMVLNQPFEKLAAEVEDGTFDSCVGNVPFGTARGETAVLDSDPASKEFTNIADYFVVRVIDKVKAGGLIGLVVPTRIVSGKDNKKMRRLISRKAEFLGAHRLPSGVFSDSGTDVVTDVIFLRKHSDDLAQKLPKLKDADLKAANVLWDTFISGKWFDVAEGKRFVHGESERLSFQNKLVVNNNNALTNLQLKEKLSHKFETRIEWDSLNAAEPLPITYAEGDEKLINGRWMSLVNGNWELIKRENDDGTINAERYGASSLGALDSMLANPLGALALSYDQLMAINTDYPYLTRGLLSDFIKLSNTVDDKYKAQVIRGSIIGMRIQALQYSDEPDETILAEARALILAESQKYGTPANNKSLTVLTGRNANYWNAFSASLDKNGEFSALLKGEVVKGETIAFDPQDATQTVANLFSVRDLVPVPLEDFLQVYTGTLETLEQLAAIEGIAITPDGMLAPLDRATSGNIVAGRERLLAAMANETSKPILENYQAQLDAIERKRTRTNVDAIDITMSAKWVPRNYVLEFLKSNGYSSLEYSRVEEDELGNQFDNKEYNGDDGLFSGYQLRDGKKRSSTNEQFERQIENYLNGLPVRSSDAAAASAYKSRIKDLEAEFGIWIRQHDDIDPITNLYNDKFNGFIPIEHSGAPLGLENTSGEIVNFDYQCSEIRRLSETGGGICGFGTGLGKTATALGLIAYNTELGRARRTALVVPKSVIDNWYHESKAFFGRQNMSNILFIGVEPVIGKGGEVEQETVLDEKGEVKLNRNTNQPMQRDKIKALSSKEVKTRLNMIPHSNFTTVVMTKEQYASIPMRPESVGEFVSKMVDAGMLGGKYVADAKKHRESLKNAKFKEKYADTGTKKAEDVPYFEDMGFDNVIIDEGHNYRNSYKAGREASKLAYLPTQASAQVSVDLSLKGQLIKEKNGGRGVVLLSATPTVNSPTDIFNMLSHVMTPDQWSQLGIVDVDDFVRVFGETDEMPVQKLSGEVEMKTALVGFKNLSGLRSLFHRHVNLKTAKDVSETVAIPDIVDVEQECPMTDEQQAIYEELRVRAEELSKLTQADKELMLAQGIPVDSVFRIIREMDRVTTDIDLYNKQMTFVFPADKTEQVNKLVAALPATLNLKVKDDDKGDEDAETTALSIAHNAKVATSDSAVTLVVNQEFENEVMKLVEQFGIKSNEISHPITPKYARLIENLKAGLEDGKQIIFTEEKTQHNKLARIIVNHLGLEPNDIAIINADTVSGKDADNEQASLEKVALAYNEGRHKILIANKKAEVGVNLHHGTTDIHHLTLPWTPASIKQRNGRGARVGSSQKKVRAHYYVGKGSFDEFRLSSLKRKAEWMNELFTSDLDRMDNADASNNEEMSLLLAKDAGEREARIAANQQKALDKVRAAQTIRAKIDLNNYIKASHDGSANKEVVAKDLASANSQLSKALADIERVKGNLERYTTLSEDKESTMRNYYLSEAKDARKELVGLMAIASSQRSKQVALERLKTRIDNADAQLKRLRPTVKKAIETGLIGDIDLAVLDHGDKFIVFEGKTLAVGKQYEAADFSKHGGRTDLIYRINSIDFNFKTAKGELLYSSSSYGQTKLGKETDISLGSLRNETTIAQSEIDFKNALTDSIKTGSIKSLMTEEKFRWAIGKGLLTISAASIGNSYSSSKILLLRDGTGFAFVSANYEAVKKELSETLVYPDPDNETLKRDLSVWILADRKERTNSSGTAISFYEAILGNKWDANIEEHGKAASAAEISKWAKTTMDSYLATEKGTSDFDDMVKGQRTYDFSWVRFYGGKMPAEFDNWEAFKAAGGNQFEALKLVAEKKKAENEAIITKGVQAAYKQAEASNEDDKDKWARWVFDEVVKSGSDIVLDLLKADSFATGISADYWQGAALAVLEKLLDTNAGVSELVYGQFGSKVKELLMKTYADRDAISKVLNPVTPEPEVETSTEDTATVEAFRATLENEATKSNEAINSQDIFDGITIKLNSVEINQPSTKYQSRGRWRTNPARYFPVGDVIAIHDPQGKSGKLFSNKEELKALVSGVFFSTDLNDDYEGSWWFVPAAAGLDNVKKVLGV